MKVKELIKILESYEENLDVVVKMDDSDRVKGIEKVNKCMLGAWQGEDRTVAVLYSDYTEGILFNEFNAIWRRK